MIDVISVAEGSPLIQQRILYYIILSTVISRTIALLHYDVKTFIKIILFNARVHGCLAGTKQRNFTENRTKNRINSRRAIN